MVSIIRDYLDVLSDFLNSSASYFDIIKITVLFFFQSLSTFLKYIVTFGWFRDIMYIPVLIPNCQQAILGEHFFYEDLNVPLFEALGAFKTGLFGSFGLGFLNSFFSCLPLSTIHLLNIRRLFVQGLLAGVVSTSGLIIGQTSLIFFTVFGLRSFIIPWFSIDPLNYVLGLVLLFTVVSGMAKETRIRPVDASERGVLVQIFFVSLFLTWTEQTGFGQALTNLNLTTEPSLLSSGATGSISHFGYFSGILIGHIVFSSLFIALACLIKDGLFILSKLPYSVWLTRANSILLVLIIGVSCSSIPYYSLDYLAASSLGFVSQDKALDSIFVQKNVTDAGRVLTSMDAVFPLPIDTDISYFDRGHYGDQEGYFKRRFEDLNYQGEYAWLVRRDKQPNLFGSAETTRTTIQDVFQPIPSSQTNGTNQSEDQNDREARKKFLLQSISDNNGNGAISDNNGNGAISNNNGNGAISNNNGASFDRSRFRMKRYDSTYLETHARDTYLIGESFNGFPLLEVPQTPLEVALKRKYYGNKVYQTLLNLEVDAFINRQPNSYLLTPDEEVQVYQKRLLLSKYHDTIREYQKLPWKDEFNEFFQGSKTFVDRAYNHQFKGHISIVRRLFAITLDGDENASKKAVLKYDQPLFSSSDDNPFIHEEISSMVANSSPFLELSDSTPFYLGWNNETRQMVLTKRFSSQVDSVNVNPTLAENGKGNRPIRQFFNNPLPEPGAKLTFITWPLQNDRVLTLKTNPETSMDVITLFEPLANLETSTIAQVISMDENGYPEIFSFPANMRFFGTVPERLAPNQGGFVWPGDGMDTRQEPKLNE